jgi:hypothetical protein
MTDTLDVPSTEVPAPEHRILGKVVVAEDFPLMHSFLALHTAEAADQLAPYRALVNSGEVQRFLLATLGQLVSDEKLAQARSRQAPTLLLHRDPYRLLSLSSVDAGAIARQGMGVDNLPGNLVSNRHPLLVGQLGDDPLHYTRYRFEAPEGLDIFSHTKLHLVERSSIAGGQVEMFADPHEVIDFAPAIGGSQMLLSLAMRAAPAPLVWLFDRDTMTAKQGVSASDAASRAQLLIQMFEGLGYDGARDLLESLVHKSQYHFLRWRAVQALLKLHTTDGIGAVKHASNDAHPHVRRAAERTLKNLAANRLM